MIRAYRIATLKPNDPLDLSEKDPHPELQPSYYGFSPKDWTGRFIDNALGLKSFLRQIMEALEKTYRLNRGRIYAYSGP